MEVDFNESDSLHGSLKIAGNASLRTGTLFPVLRTAIGLNRYMAAPKRDPLFCGHNETLRK